MSAKFKGEIQSIPAPVPTQRTFDWEITRLYVQSVKLSVHLAWYFAILKTVHLISYVQDFLNSSVQSIVRRFAGKNLLPNEFHS